MKRSQIIGYFEKPLTSLTLPCLMLKNGQTYSKKFAVFTPQDFKIMFGNFSRLCTKGLSVPFTFN